jgi:hypothetical protein
VVSTYKAEGSDECLCVKQAIAKEPEDLPLLPGLVLGGKWAQHEHCNHNVRDKTAQEHISWVVYLDKRVFGANYMCNA